MEAVREYREWYGDAVCVCVCVCVCVYIYMDSE
jgi:hypothetical protein